MERPYSIEEARAAASDLGISQESVKQVYPNFHRDRVVFRVVNDKGDKVFKVRKRDQSAATEAEKIQRLVSSYRFSGGHFPMIETHDLGSRLAIEMPYLGESLTAIAQDLDDPAQQFRGFRVAEMERLLSRLDADQNHFGETYGLIHCDLIMPRFGPSNVVYNPNLRSLLLVDGEALRPYDDEGKATFVDQLGNLREWMYGNLET